MNPFFSAIIYAVLHRRVRCSHCGSLDHHKMLDRQKFLCRKCGREFVLYPEEK